MSAINDFAALLETTEVMKQLLRGVKEEPAHLLGDICREHQETGHPVPDHHLHLAGYLGDASLKALLSLQLIKRQPGGRLSLYAYEPTPQGLEQYQRLKADGFYKR
jgi:hypothetical protein